MNKEIPLADKLMNKAKEYADQAGQPQITGEIATADAFQGISLMLAQLGPANQNQEYSRIKKTALLLALQTAKEKGPVEAARFLLGHAVAAKALELSSSLEFNLDKGKLENLAAETAEKIKAKLE